MGCDVYLFKVNQNQLIGKMADKRNFEIPFTEYVEQNNIKEQRTASWSKLNAEVIITKAKTNFYQLSRDEFWEILLWINYSIADKPEWGLQFENEKVEAKLNEFGFNLIEDFQDNTRVLLFALGDFLHGVYNDSEDETRTYACLTTNEIDLFINYVSYLYGTVLTRLDYESVYRLDITLSEIIDNNSKNILLRDLVESESALIINTKSNKPDGIVFDNNSGREIYSGDLDLAIYRCQQLKRLLKDNQYPILILDSQ